MQSSPWAALRPSSTSLLPGVVVLLAIISSTACTTNADGISNVPEEIMGYIADKDGCVLVDGYQCADFENDDFLSLHSQQQLVHGNLLKAWQVALQEFQSQQDLSDEQKKLKHYKIGFSDSKEAYIVLFQGLLLPHVTNGEFAGTATATLGRTTKYWIDKNSYQVIEKKYYK